jgi:hypothetical protein
MDQMAGKAVLQTILQAATPLERHSFAESSSNSQQQIKPASKTSHAAAGIVATVG